MARNSTERLGGKYDLKSRESAFSGTPEQESTHQLPKHIKNWYYAGFKAGDVFARPLVLL